MLKYLYRTSQTRLEKLPTEIKDLVLFFLAAQDVHHLQAVRRTSRSSNTTILVSEHKIVWCALNSQNSPYHTAHRLYDDLDQGVDRNFGYLFGMARRCEIAKQLAIAIADNLQTSQSLLLGRRLDEGLDEPSRNRFIKNAEPYVLALANFFECYRNRLASWVNGIPRPNPARSTSERVQFSILSGRYNKETMYRICALYHLLKCIVSHKLTRLYLTHQRARITMRSHIHPGVGGIAFFNGPIDLFTFGGLEAIKDIVAETDPSRYSGIVEDHLARAYPYQIARSHNLLPSTLPVISRAAAHQVLSLLPHGAQPFLSYYSPGSDGVPNERRPLEQELDCFYEHLTTYEGGEPELVL